MFSQEYDNEITRYFRDLTALLEHRAEELEGKAEQLPEGEKGLYRHSAALLRQKLAEIGGVLEECDSDEAQALRFLYSAMPLSDVLDYPAAVYLAYAKHGAFLWREGPFAGKVPERIFANYVLHHRIHNEDMSDARRFFYDRLAERIRGRDMYGAAVEANYWCLEKATYQTSYMRTQSPLTMYGTGEGRCGEEAPFCVTALRSIGIPAREVVSPYWSHCDSNHAWVEAWCDGKWHFLGGCEPEDTLDQGWFVEPCSRAMLIYSQWFGRDKALEATTESPDMSPRVNQLGLYADTVELTVRVKDEQGNPVPGARVEFSLLNFARIGRIATLTTGGEKEGETFGSVKLETGRGDLWVSAYGKDGQGEVCYGECQVSLLEDEDVSADGIAAAASEEENAAVKGQAKGNAAEKGQAEDSAAGKGQAERNVAEKGLTEGNTAGKGLAEDSAPEKDAVGSGSEKGASTGDGRKRECTVIIRKEMPGLEQWRDIDFHAPKAPVKDKDKLAEQPDAAAESTAEQPAKENPRLAEATKIRQDRMERFYRKPEAERVLKRFHGEDRELVDKILHQARGNMMEIVRFLEWDFAGRAMELTDRYGSENWKLEALKTLKPNDCWDIRAEVLAECCCYASPYAADIPEDIFFSSLVSPCVLFERPKACRAALLDALNEEMRAQIRRNPGYLREVLEGLVQYLPKQEYANLINTPTGCLTGGLGSEISRDVLCVQIYRALGIPARMNPMDRRVEYYAGGKFIPVTEKEAGDQGTLILQTEGGLTLKDRGHFSLSRLEDGQNKPVFLMPKEGEAEMALQLETGLYRIVTTNRSKNGDQFARMYDFRLEAGQEKKIALALREIPEEPAQPKIALGEYALHTEDGEERLLSAAGGKGRSLFLWLELAKEPTEHVLNEMLGMAETCKQLGAPICFVVRQGADYESDTTLSKVRVALPDAEVLRDGFGEEYRALCEKIGRPAGKLPLAMILEDGCDCIYSDAGYNVGMADALVRSLKGAC